VEICTVGSVRGESVGAAMVDLNAHEAGNGGESQGTPKAHCVLLYSDAITPIPKGGANRYAEPATVIEDPNERRGE